jgi:hypothetical protein
LDAVVKGGCCGEGRCRSCGGHTPAVHVVY